MTIFDSPSGAELFPSRSGKPGKRAGYRRFASAAEGVRFAIEELPAPLLLGACLEIDEKRFDRDGIRALYDSPAYPLPRASDGCPEHVAGKADIARAGRTEAEAQPRRRQAQG